MNGNTMVTNVISQASIRENQGFRITLREQVLTKLSTAIASAAIYLPVIAGIITPMVYLLPAWYLSWDVAKFIFPFYEIWHGLLSPSGELFILLLQIIQVVLFLTGMCIFLYALLEMTRQIAKGSGLVTTGPYKWIRHPQHLGILLFLLSFTLYLQDYSEFNTGIRPGDILSWSLMTFLLIAVADWEDSRLIKKFGDAYLTYHKKTPFLLPVVERILPSTNIQALSPGRPLRYILAFVIYWILMCVVLFGFLHSDLVFTRWG